MPGEFFNTIFRGMGGSMDFQQALQQFRQLEEHLQAGRIDLAQYRAALVALRVVDGRGIHWQMQERSGAWYYYWQGQWVAGTLPVETAVPAPHVEIRPEAVPLPPAPVQPAPVQPDPSLQYAETVAVPKPWPAAPVQPPPFQPTAYPQGTAGAYPAAPPPFPPIAAGQTPARPSYPQRFPQGTAGAYPVQSPPFQPPVYPQGFPQGFPQGTANAYGGRAPLQKRRSRLPLALGLTALLVILAAGGYLLVTQVLNKPAAPVAGPGAVTVTGATVQPPLPLEYLTLLKLSDSVVTADGSPVTDANGVSIQIPAAALQTDSGKVMVTTSKLQGQLADAIASGYTINSPAYTVEAEGQQDSTGRATLSFPAPNPNTRLVEIIDDQYTVLVDNPPVNGRLTFATRMGPSNTEGLATSGSIHFNGSQRFIIVTPKQAAAPGAALVSSRRDTFPGKKCGIDVNPNTYVFTYCIANEARTVDVLYRSDQNFTADQAYAVAKEAEKWMAKYATIGFTNADLSRYWFAMKIIIEDGSGDPSYSAKTGNIYLPMDYAKNISGATKALGHELGHWIQDEAYKMAWAGLKSVIYSANNYWWLEVAAENMVMLADPTYIKGNLDEYGLITAPDNRLVFQMAINQWPADFYAQAQLVKVFMCDNSTCPLSEKTFAEAITNGTYPFRDAETLIGANLEDYARYLIGAAPQKTNTAISLSGVTSPSFGEVLQVTQKAGKSKFNLLGGAGRQPDINNETKDGFDQLVFDVALERDGVYPLSITSEAKYAGLPAMLVIEAGIPLVYRLDDGEVKQHSGDRQLIIGPINGNLGYSKVRLAAYSSASGTMHFKARLQIVDLKGAWAVQAASDIIKNGVTCDNPPKTGVDNLYQLLPVYGNISMALGDFAPSGSADKLTWTLVPGRVPADVKDPWTTVYEVELTPDAVILKGLLDVPRGKSASSGPGEATAGMAGLAVGVVGLVGGRRLFGRRPRRLLAIGLPLALLALLLAGCVGFYGSSQMEIKITRFEASNGDTDATWNIWTQALPDTKAIWTITQATGTYLILSTTETDVGDLLKPVISYNNCSGSLTYNLKGGIYPDITIIFEDHSLEPVP